MDEMKDEFANFTNQVAPSTMSNGDASSLGGLLNIESSEPSNITADFKVGGLSLTGLNFLDLSYFKQGITYFRPVINAFLAWLLGMFYYNEFLAFIGQGPLMTKAKGEFETYKTSQDNPNVRGKV